MTDDKQQIDDGQVDRICQMKIVTNIYVQPQKKTHNNIFVDPQRNTV